MTNFFWNVLVTDQETGKFIRHRSYSEVEAYAFARILIQTFDVLSFTTVSVDIEECEIKQHTETVVKRLRHPR